MYHDISRITPRTRKYRDLLDSIVSHTSSRHKQKPWARFWVNAQAWMMRTYNIPRCSHFGNKIRPCFELPSKHKLGIPSDAVLPGGFASGTLVQGGPACSFAAPAMSYYGLPPTKFANEYNEFEKLLRVPPLVEKGKGDLTAEVWRVCNVPLQGASCQCYSRREVGVGTAILLACWCKIM